MWQRFRHDSGDPTSLSSDWVYALHLDSNGSVWIGTRGGLDRIVGDPRSRQGILFQNVSQKDGLRSAVINGIRSDAQGGIWVSTERGLSRYDAGSGRIDNYTANHGLQSDNFNQGSHYQSASGELFFGGGNGINAFYPERLEWNRSPPPIALTQVLKMNRPVEADVPPSHLLESLDLDWRDDIVTFEFAALDFAAPAANRYAYKLDGFDRDWVDSGARRRVTYTNLDGGSYVFRGKGSNNDGVWNEEGITLALSVAAPPWKTWWAYTIYVILILMIMTGIYRVQQRKLAYEADHSRRLEREVALRTEELAEANAQLHKTNEQLEELSLNDQLTGLRNRRYLHNMLDEEVVHIERHYLDALRQGRTPVLESPNFMFVMIDLDGFKPINDTYGHAAGDRVLIEVKNAMRECFRKADTIVRWGGDEFMIACRDCDPAAVETLVRDVHRTIREREIRLDNGRTVNVGCSLGFAFYPFIADDPALVSWEKALAIADKALYLAKESGKNAWAGIVSNGFGLTAELIEELAENPNRLIAEGAVDLHATFGSIPTINGVTQDRRIEGKKIRIATVNGLPPATP